MASLEGFLNVAIPIGIFLFLFGVIWYKLRVPMSAFFKWLVDLFGWTKEKMASGAANPKNYAEEIIYR